eukprot:TRINITY_DN52351_c0_g1_i1.p1 TRINITY_DN52351_c0_g1~~TRINITY_DN52351_c0_g1_i1.p1  ORF type:complete len:313 (-),score=109.27 TRINITY_DN52351_c0_g1_i1:187-1101(-)
MDPSLIGVNFTLEEVEHAIRGKNITSRKNAPDLVYCGSPTKTNEGCGKFALKKAPSDFHGCKIHETGSGALRKDMIANDSNLTACKMLDMRSVPIDLSVRRFNYFGSFIMERRAKLRRKKHQKALAEKSEVLEDINTDLLEKNDDLVARNNTLFERNEDLEEHNDALANVAVDLVTENDGLLGKNNILYNRNNELEEHNNELVDVAGALVNENDELKEKFVEEKKELVGQVEELELQAEELVCNVEKLTEEKEEQVRKEKERKEKAAELFKAMMSMLGQVEVSEDFVSQHLEKLEKEVAAMQIK